MSTVTTINETGLREIAEFLAAHHKLGGDYFTRDMLSAWAAEAEESADAGNPAMIEIRAHDSVSGAPITFTISAAGVDVEEIDADA